MRTLLTLLALAGTAQAQSPITVSLDPSANLWTWSGTSSFGPVVGSPTATFDLGGTVNLLVDSGVTPVSIGQFVPGGVATVSPNPTGVILNPMPFMPPIGTFEVVDLTVEFTSGLFAVAGNGDFTAAGTATALSGTMVLNIDPNGTGSPYLVELDMAGEQSPAQPFSGNIAASGNGIALQCDASGFFTYQSQSNSATMNLAGTLDGTWTADAPASYCDANPNSTGGVSEITFLGSQSIADDDVTLQTSGLPANKFAYYLVSATDGYIANAPGSQGNICLGGTIGRYTNLVGQSTGAGLFTRSVGTTNLPVIPPASISPGETWYYQLWHRDFDPTPTSNFSRGLAVTFAP